MNTSTASQHYDSLRDMLKNDDTIIYTEDIVNDNTEERRVEKMIKIPFKRRKRNGVVALIFRFYEDGSFMRMEYEVGD
jgi:hypothetical protein